MFMDLEKLRTTIAERFEYLFRSEFHNRYTVLAPFYVDVTVINKTKTIEELDFTIQIDDTRANDGNAYDIGRMLRECGENLSNFFYKYPLNPTTFKFDKNYDKFIVHDAFFLEFHFKMDELHKMDVSIRIDYTYDN